jgi:hypothetical protein
MAPRSISFSAAGAGAGVKIRPLIKKSDKTINKNFFIISFSFLYRNFFIRWEKIIAQGFILSSIFLDLPSPSFSLIGKFQKVIDMECIVVIKV